MTWSDGRPAVTAPEEARAVKTLLHTTTGHVAAGAVARPRVGSGCAPCRSMAGSGDTPVVASSFATRHRARRLEEPSQ